VETHLDIVFQLIEEAISESIVDRFMKLVLFAENYKKVANHNSSLIVYCL